MNRRLCLTAVTLLFGCSTDVVDDGTTTILTGTSDSGAAEGESGGAEGQTQGDGDSSGDGDGTSGGDGTTTSGDGTSGDGDGTTTSGDGTSGDGDGTTTSGDGTSGDGDGTSGDGDGDGTSGDGDGTSGDGDGTSGDGDGTSGDGDGTSGDGDGTSGDGDGTSGDGTSGDGDGTSGDGDGTSGDGDGTSGDGTSGDGTSGDGDGTSGDGDGTTSGDGDGTTSGDGDGTTGDGTTGDGTTGDGTTGDGTTGDGDGTTGDGDGTAGDGDGTTGDGDGDGCLLNPAYCDPLNATQCNGAAVETCAFDVTSGCNLWTTTTADCSAAPGGLGTCGGTPAACQDPCAGVLNTCSVDGATQCTASDVIQTCQADAGQNGCLTWQDTTDCGAMGAEWICSTATGTPACEETIPCLVTNPTVTFDTSSVMFVLDYSGSMSQCIQGPAGSCTNNPGNSRWAGLWDVVDGVSTTYQNTLRFGAQLFPSPGPVTSQTCVSDLDCDPCWSGTTCFPQSECNIDGFCQDLVACDVINTPEAEHVADSQCSLSAAGCNQDSDCDGTGPMGGSGGFCTFDGVTNVNNLISSLPGRTDLPLGAQWTPAQSGYSRATDYVTGNGNNIPSDEDIVMIFVLDGAISDGGCYLETQGPFLEILDGGRECSPGSCSYMDNQPVRYACGDEPSSCGSFGTGDQCEDVHQSLVDRDCYLWQPSPTENQADQLTQLIDDNYIQDGIRTFVVGIDMDYWVDQDMDAYAYAGGVPQGGAEPWYDAADTATLLTALEGILSTVATCDILLDVAAPPTGVDVRVTVNGGTINEDPTANSCTGTAPYWYYSDAPTNLVVTLCNTACTDFQATGDAAVEYFCTAG